MAKLLVQLERALAHELAWLVNADHPQIFGDGFSDIREVRELVDRASVNLAWIHAAWAAKLASGFFPVQA